MARLNRTIDFNAENPCPVYNMGHVGEHCSTVLTIIAPESLSIANGATYICAAVETGGRVVRSQLQTNDEDIFTHRRTIVLPLTRDYTQSEYFNLQVEGYSTDEGADGTNNFVGKSKMIKGLRLAPSVEGENVLEGAEPQTVAEAIAAMLPESVEWAVEIGDPDNEGYTKYNVAQIEAFVNAGKLVTLDGHPILSKIKPSGNGIKFYVMQKATNSLSDNRIVCVLVNVSKEIIPQATYWLPAEQNAQFNRIEKIFTAGGTELTPVAKYVTLPDFALASDVTTAISDVTTAINAVAAIDITGKTGLEIKTLWDAGKALMDGAKRRIISLESNYTLDNTEGILYGTIEEFTLVTSNKAELLVVRHFRANNSTSNSSTIKINFTLRNDDFKKLYGGAVAGSNSSFVTGGQVFNAIEDALEEADITVVATSSKTIASSITGSNSVTWDTLTANKTLEQLLARVTAHKPIRVGGYLKSALSLSGSEETFTNSYIYQPWEVIYAGKVEGGWLADEMGCNLEDADPESYGVVVRVSQRYTSSGNMKFSAVAQQDIIVYKDTNGDTKVTYLGTAF